MILKTPFEKFPIIFNFANDLQRAETITSYEKKCINTLTNANSAVEIIDSDSLLNSKEVRAIIKDGVLEASHKITINALTNLSGNFETDLTLEIREVITDYFTKQSSEEFVIRQDFTRAPLVTGDSIVSVNITAKKVSDGSSATADVYVSNTIASPMIYVLLKGGINGEDYLFSIKATTNLGYKYEKLILMSIEDL